MSEKAMGNHYSKTFFNWAGIVFLMVLAAGSLGFWLGGWRQSELLQFALQQIPDLNPCY
jgi:hypothetical protein